MKDYPPSAHAGQDYSSYVASSQTISGSSAAQLLESPAQVNNPGRPGYTAPSAHAGQDYNRYIDQTTSAPPPLESTSSESGPSNTVAYPVNEALSGLAIRSDTDSDTDSKVAAEEHYRVLPKDAIYVELKLEVLETGDLLHFYHEDQHYVKSYSDWEDRMVSVEGKSYECFLCTGKKTGKHFWTYSLSDLQHLEKEKKKGKGKGKSKR